MFGNKGILLKKACIKYDNRVGINIYFLTEQ